METTELLDDLQNGYFIFQNSEGFKFGIDAVLLADFAKECSGRIIDLCSGNGIIPLLLAAKTKVRHIDAVEIQPEMAELAEKSVVYNGLSDRIHIKCLDLKNACTEYGRGVFDAVTARQLHDMRLNAPLRMLFRRRADCLSRRADFTWFIVRQGLLIFFVLCGKIKLSPRQYGLRHRKSAVK